jgi:hypothetical protein
VLKIRPATDKDNPQILKLLKELDLYFSSLSPKDFWVADSWGLWASPGACLKKA